MKQLEMNIFIAIGMVLRKGFSLLSFFLSFFFFPFSLSFSFPFLFSSYSFLLKLHKHRILAR
jgi:hypothetical protein